MNSSPDISAIVSFSRELKNAREFRSIPLNDIERKTRIARSHLEALESAHWDDVPDGFLRGFVGLYAEAVGMNRDRVLRDYDSLMNPDSAADRARLVSVRPLLKYPERVGLTRAKIAAAWFSNLTASSHLKQILTFFALLAIIAGPAWLRQKTAPDPPSPIPFASIVSEYRSRSHGPMTEIPLIASEDSLSGSDESAWLSVIARRAGQVVFQQDRHAARSLIYSPLDTINIQYVKELSLSIISAKSAVLQGFSGPILPDSVSHSNRAFYHILPEKPSATPPDTVH